MRSSIFILAFLFAGAQHLGALADELVSFSGNTMGTTYSIKLGELPAGIAKDQLQSEIDDALEDVNDWMSTWREDSEISRFNRFENTDWFSVSQETAAVVETALTVSRETGGAFDITVGPLVNLWNFGPGEKQSELPTEKEIAEAKSRVGYQHLDVRTSPPALRKSVPNLNVDLSAIAKGFGVDQVVGILETKEITSYMVEIGGEVRAAGFKPDGSKWRLGIEKPTPLARSVQRAVELDAGALATSGDYRNFRVVDGQQYSHTIDPRTGRPVEHALGSVSVVAESCMLADAYATALMVMGPETGYAWAQEQELAALFIVREGDALAERVTPAFEQGFPSPKETPKLLTTWLITAGIFLAVILLMSVGVIVSNRRISGSCGGLANMKDASGNTLCDACTNPAPDCQGNPPENANL